MADMKHAHIFEEFTRFGGGQTVFEDVYRTLASDSYEIKLITDRKHPLIPSYISPELIIETKLENPRWDSPARLLPTIVKLKRELKKFDISGFTFNNHPNVFLFNATINFGHELFGFMAHSPRPTDKVVISTLKGSGLFREYDGGYFLTSGKFTERQIRETLTKLGVRGIKTERMDLSVKLPERVATKDKEKAVLTFGRISPDKNLEVVLSVAKSFPDTRFVIAGRVLDIDEQYFTKLLKEKTGNVEIIANPTAETKDKLYRKSLVYFHSKKNENYGISVAEAIAYGCFPIVPEEGGAFEDVLLGGKIGYGYSNEMDATEKVNDGLETQPETLGDIMETRERFSPLNFRKRLLEIIDQRKE